MWDTYLSNKTSWTGVAGWWFRCFDTLCNISERNIFRQQNNIDNRVTLIFQNVHWLVNENIPVVMISSRTKVSVNGKKYNNEAKANLLLHVFPDWVAALWLTGLASLNLLVIFQHPPQSPLSDFAYVCRILPAHLLTLCHRTNIIEINSFVLYVMTSPLIDWPCFPLLLVIFPHLTHRSCP